MHSSPAIQTEKMDLSTLPKPSDALPQLNVTADSMPTVTIGDLHGNALKLIHLLIRYNMATGLDENDYQQLMKYYSIDWLNASADELTASLKGFEAILEKIQWNDQVQLRLLGDILADRGRCDYLTLLVIKKLHINHVPIEIIFSNHDALAAKAIMNAKIRDQTGMPGEISVLEAIQHAIALIQNAQSTQWLLKHYPKQLMAYQKTYDAPIKGAPLTLTQRAEKEKMLRGLKAILQLFIKDTPLSMLSIAKLSAQAVSIATTQQLIALNIITQQEYMDLFEKHYLPQLKLLSSTFSADHSHLSIFTHAPVGLKTIQEIAKYFGCKDCKIDSALEIHQTIKAINEAFSEVIKADDIHTLQSSCPFIEDLLWNRNNDIPTDPKPLTRGNTAIHYYNGHTSGPTSLDNPVGKEEMWFLKRHIQFICKLKTFSKQYHQCPELLEIFQAIQKDINNLNEQNFIPATHPFVIQTEPPLKPRLHKHPHP